MNNYIKQGLLLLCFCFQFLMNACRQPQHSVSSKELKKYINRPDNGLVKEVESNGIKISVSFQPSSFMVMHELELNKEKDTAKIKTLENKYRGHYCFLLKYSKNGGEVIRQLGSFSKYSDMVQVFSFEMHRFINITTPMKDTLPISDYMFEQTYGMNDGNFILLNFEGEQLEKNKWFDINIAECGLGTGNTKLSFRKEDLQNIPTLDYFRIE